jgi:enediyne biosynthesis protein E4
VILPNTNRSAKSIVWLLGLAIQGLSNWRFALCCLLATVCGCKQSSAPPKTSQARILPNETVDEPSTARRTPRPPSTELKQASPWFVELDRQRTGLNFSFSSGRSAGEYAIIESLGGGLAAWDYDSDGNVDLMVAGGGMLDNRTVTAKPSGLFRNLGNGRFTDVTVLAGANADAFYTHGIYHGDWDNDGFRDCAVSGYGGVQLLHNQGDGTFVTLSPLKTDPSHPWSSSLAFADFDGNGALDLYVAHYVDWSWSKHPVCPGQYTDREVCAPREFNGIADAIYFGDGTGGFNRLQKEVGLVAGGKGLGVVAADLDLDGDSDIYVANDTTDNFLYINDGQGKFEETGVIAGVAGGDNGFSTGSMGTSVFDANGDQKPDIWVVNFERELFGLYRNEGDNLFAHSSRAFGLGALEGSYVGFGTLPIDFDLDGDLDLVVVNGHVSYASPHSPFKQHALLLQNHRNQRFNPVQRSGYFDVGHTGRGLVQADFDGDHLLDLAVSHLEEPVSLLKGTPKVIPGGQITLRLIGTRSHRDAIGAVVRCGKQMVMNNGGGSYLSQSEERLWLTGLDPSQTVHQLEIQWPGGTLQTLNVPRQDTMELVVIEPN